MKTPVIRKKDYIVYFELHEGSIFIHCDCHRWSKTVKQNLIKDLDVLCSLQDMPIYGIHEINDNKHLKFLTMCGFTFVTSVVCLDGVKRQIFERKV
jgi:hypothetical protein